MMTGEEPAATGNTIGGGLFQAPVLQGRDIQATFQLSAATPTALAQLPQLAAGFTGRDAELGVLTDLLDPATAAGRVTVLAVAGLAGVGKTTLAVAAGHAAVRDGWIGGGVLFVDLHGYDLAPVDPAQALDALLRALGVAAEYIPAGEEERTRLYRSVLAQITAPVLVIADNACSEAQVRPLLPGTGPHKVIVTSRHTLAGLDARLVDLTVLDYEDAISLLDGALRAARPDDDRITGDQEAAGRLAAVCGGLPLALQIVAAVLKADATLHVDELADELRTERDRLAALRYDDGTSEGGLSVEGAFDLSYARLNERSAQVFRMLSLNPGSEISIAAAAVLANLPVSKVRPTLSELAKAHLIEAAPAAAGRWRMHDLIKLYAKRRSDADAVEDQPQLARERLLLYYLDTARAANGYRGDWVGMVVPPEFSGPADQMAWLDAERPNLVAAITVAADTGQDRVAVVLPIMMAEYLKLRRRFDDWMAVAAVSLNTARRIHDRSAEALALLTFGNALAEVRRFDEALSLHYEALAIYREIGDRHAEGMALGTLGATLQDMGRFAAALAVNLEAAEIFKNDADELSRAQALGNLGIALAGVRRFDEAVTAHENSIAIFRKYGSRHAEGQALNNLGTALQGAGRFSDAIAAHRDAAAIHEATSDRHSVGIALANLGAALEYAARFTEAIAVLEDAVAVLQETDDLYGTEVALATLKRLRRH
jgi:tetratricopeptide (TPR) repeat protein